MKARKTDARQFSIFVRYDNNSRRDVKRLSRFLAQHIDLEGNDITGALSSPQGNLFALPDIVLTLAPGVAYIGKKAVDIIADIVKQWYLSPQGKTSNLVSVNIYGPDGKVISTVQRDEADALHSRALIKRKTND